VESKWNLENIQEIALKYKHKTNFKMNDNAAYIAARRLKILDKVSSHMIDLKKPANYWNNFEICRAEALKYNNMTDFRTKASACFENSEKNNWLSEITNHFIVKQKPKHYWNNFEICRIEALKYSNKIDLHNKASACYKSAYENNWLDIICSHMEIVGNYITRCIYVFEFNNNHAYIELTCNLNNRINQHLTNENNSSVFEYIKETNLIPVIKQLTDYISVNEAKNMEKYYIEEYRKNGWNILNKVEGGSIGGKYEYWTYKKCQDEISKYIYFNDFRKNSKDCYNAILRKKWLNELTNNLIRTIKPPNYWNNLELCIEEASKYKNRTELKTKRKGCYNALKRNSWFDKVKFK
jgi:predicted GIY-YIG superfamily endonuclease